MKITPAKAITRQLFRGITAFSLLFGFYSSSPLLADDALKTNAPDWVPLVLKLPAPVFAGTPKAAPPDSTAEIMPDKPGPPLQIPRDARNIAPGKKITSSDKNATR